ncbi:hypothetical protein Cgig2_013977 [Carnegiea gigantea]|uniref:C2H2-type domain-containing protein n=1 Tax=Carnegiea gigantea TaxID=171969 RepID=A0A9Q1KWK9_9CARY|nr:hypothetical protein Cgig2_013977 [Carnegiea gigantea]
MNCLLMPRRAALSPSLIVCARVEVKNGGSVKVQPGDDKVVHLSQACFGDVKKDKGSEFVRLFAQKDGQKFVIGILSLEKFPHINLDLVFEDEFELSHDWKHGSVHFAGYKADNPDAYPFQLPRYIFFSHHYNYTFCFRILLNFAALLSVLLLYFLDCFPHSQRLMKMNLVSPYVYLECPGDDLEEPVPVNALNNGKPETTESKASGNKANASDVPSAEGGSDDDDDDSDEDEESDEETPKKPEPSKKRPGESTSKTPIPDKKAKLATPQQKAEGKKVSGHVATPHPAKQVAKTPANTGKSSKQTPKSGGSFACSSCSRTFGSEQAVQSHSKAKHGSVYAQVFCCLCQWGAGNVACVSQASLLDMSRTDSDLIPIEK